MRETIKHRIILPDEKKQALWNDAVFVFDTNVLLALYRFSKKTSESLINAISSKAPNVWIPKQVALEFANNRYSIIYNNEKKFDDDGEIAKAKKTFIDIFRKEVIDKECVHQIEEIIDSWLSGLKDENAYVTNPQDDAILDVLCTIFENKVGKGYSHEALEQISKEGSNRFSKKIPPGYKDSNKDDNQYGDLIIWKEIIDFSKEKDVDIVFVTQDVKEDWWQIEKGKTVGPRYELREEFYECTGHIIHFYNVRSFMERCNQIRGVENDQRMIKEIESLPAYEADTDVSIWEEELKKDYDTIKMAEQHSRLLETILDREGEVADLNARIERLDFKIHRMRDRLDNLATEDTPPEEFLQKKEFMEKDLAEMEKHLSELQENRKSRQAELELLIKHARWD